MTRTIPQINYVKPFCLYGIIEKGMKKLSEKIRLDKFLSNLSMGSRKDVSKLVRSGAAAVNGIPVKSPDVKIDPLLDTVALNGETVIYSKHIYIMMNKPAGVLSAARDKNAKTVIDLVPESIRRRELFPAGRLDKDTTGLLIITDDGDFAHKMLSPKSHVYKLYEAELDGDITDEDILAFKQGIKSGDNEFLPAKLFLPTQNPKIARVEIREGKFHQVKRMFLAREKTVLTLKRLRIGLLDLDSSLGEGDCKVLDYSEIENIFR